MNLSNVLTPDALANYWNGPMVGANLVVFLNLLGAFALGLFVGYERSYRGRAAGMRTYGLVCMASCALTVISGYPEFWFGGAHPSLSSVDPGRIIQGVVTGIGFLGAGVIMREGGNISGLNTAASIWTVSAIGVLVGVGFYAAAILLSLLSTVFMWWGLKIEDLLPGRQAISVTLHFRKDMMPSQEYLQQTILAHGFIIATGSFVVARHADKSEWRFLIISLGKGKGASLVNLSRVLSAAEGIESFHLSHARN
ncbi:MAG: MgtC/SapB family protein [Bdellovibrionales bacterium]